MNSKVAIITGGAAGTWKAVGGLCVHNECEECGGLPGFWKDTVELVNSFESDGAFALDVAEEKR